MGFGKNSENSDNTAPIQTPGRCLKRIGFREQCANNRSLAHSESMLLQLPSEVPHNQFFRLGFGIEKNPSFVLGLKSGINHLNYSREFHTLGGLKNN